MAAHPPASRTAAARKALFESYRRQRASSWIQVSGHSMRPLIRAGTWVLVDFGALPVGPGEIVLFAARDALVVHRVAGVLRWRDKPAITTKGDGELRFDPPLQIEEILGVIRARRSSVQGCPRRFGCRGFSARAMGGASTAIGLGAEWSCRVRDLMIRS